MQFSVTFERYMPRADDADCYCEADESGFVVQNVSLRDAVRLGLEYREPSYAGPCEADCYPLQNVRWLHFYSWNDGTRDQIENGVQEQRSLHFPHSMTEASRRRVCRMFGLSV